MSNRRRPSSPPSGVASPSAREGAALESLGESFEEATEHALAEGGVPDARFGPLGVLGLEELLPGEIGWFRTVSDGTRGPLGRIVFVIVPAAVGRTPARAALGAGAGSPRLAGVAWIDGPPPQFVAALVEEPTASQRLARLAGTVARNLRADD